MGSYWVFEVLPLAITALIPMVLFPFFEIMKSEDVAASYLPVPIIKHGKNNTIIIIGYIFSIHWWSHGGCSCRKI